jgi:hypothetical protein
MYTTQVWKPDHYLLMMDIDPFTRILLDDLMKLLQQDHPQIPVGTDDVILESIRVAWDVYCSRYTPNGPSTDTHAVKADPDSRDLRADGPGYRNGQ